MKLIQHTGFGAETPSRKLRKKMSGFTITPSTVVIENAPEYDALTYDIKRFLVGEAVEIELRVGWSKTHPNDDFNRKVGLELATSRLKVLKATLESAYVEKGSFRVVFKTDDGTLCLKDRLGKRPVIDGQSLTGLNY